METPNIPTGYQQVMPYLILHNAPGFLQFMQQIFGAEQKVLHTRDEKTIAHAEITIGACTIMFADATSAYAATTGGFFIYVDDADAIYEKAIAAGSISLNPVADMPYGRSGGIQDPFGNAWWVTTNTPG